jgi:hypothetical protein
MVLELRAYRIAARNLHGNVSPWENPVSLDVADNRTSRQIFHFESSTDPYYLTDPALQDWICSPVQSARGSQE